MARRNSLFRPVNLIGAAILIFLSGLIVWLILQAGSDERRESPSANGTVEREASTQASQPAPPSPSVMTDKQKESLNEVVHDFIAAYYDRDASLTEAELRQRVSRSVVPLFMERQQPDLSTESDRWVRENNGTIEATATILGQDGSVTPDRALVPVSVEVVGTANGQTLEPYSFMAQVEVVWQKGTWKIRTLN